MSAPRLDASKIAAARLWATNQMPYLASAIFAAPVLAASDSATVAVDRSWQIHADPNTVDGLTVEQLGRLLLHLIGHLVREHADRAAALGLPDVGSPEAWNRAADAEINDDLHPLGLLPDVAPDLPGGLKQADGLLAENYFTVATPPRRWDCGSGCDDQRRQWDVQTVDGLPRGACLDAEQAAMLRLGIAAAIQQANNQLPGTVPGGWMRWAENLLPSKVDWRRLLAAEIRAGIFSVAGAVDYTYRRPSRRFRVSPRVVLPALHRPVPEIVVVCDTSGSMHDELLARALAEIEGILTKAGLRSRQLRVLAVDTAVHTARRVSRAAQVQLVGGGGTDMGAGIEAAAASRPKPSIVIVVTDGFTPWPDRPPKGIHVIVGLLAQHHGMALPPAPSWARTIVIE
ncbi:MAG: vWA domain-containing protein [Acidimicrobiales bacterium]